MLHDGATRKVVQQMPVLVMPSTPAWMPLERLTLSHRSMPRQVQMRVGGVNAL